MSTWVLSLPCCLIGTALLWRGFRGTRHGHDPYCRRCRYNLTGLLSNCCPECGAELHGGAIVHGLRRPSWAFAIVGAVVTALGAGVIAVHVGQVDVYAACPTWLLLHMARCDIDGALQELDTRVRRPGISAGQSAQIADVCLARQSNGETGLRTRQRWIDLLHCLYVTGQLDAERQQRYFEQAVSDIRFSVQTPDRTDGRLRIDVSVQCRLPSFGLWPEMMEQQVTLDDESPLQYGGQWTVPFGIGMLRGQVWPKVMPTPGQHRLTYSAVLILHGGSGQAAGTRWSQEVSEVLEFEIRE